MTAFIKFCGGCNSKFDRGAAAKVIKTVFADKLSFYAHDVNVPCDIGIIISGCETECVREKNLAHADLYVRINSEQSIDVALKTLRDFINK